MHPAELSILLHRALELRLDRLEGLMGEPGWAEEAEPLHRVRVASRRVRAVLGMVDPGLYPAFGRQSRKLEALTRLLGPTREWDVQVQRLEALGHQLGTPAAWAALEHALELLERQRQKARKRLLRGVAGKGFGGLRKLREVPVLPNPFLPGDARRGAWEAQELQARELVQALPEALEREEVERLHGLRIRVKRLRYSLEVLAEAFSVDLGEALEGLHRLQGALGDHHDQALLEAFLWQCHGGLQLRQRRVLAEGTLDLLGLVAESRREQYERFRAQAGALAFELLLERIRHGFGSLASSEGGA